MNPLLIQQESRQAGADWNLCIQLLGAGLILLPPEYPGHYNVPGPKREYLPVLAGDGCGITKSYHLL